MSRDSTSSWTLSWPPLPPLAASGFPLICLSPAVSSLMGGTTVRSLASYSAQVWWMTDLDAHFTLVLKLIYCFLAVPAACASSQGRDWTCTTAAACPSCCRDKAGSLIHRATGDSVFDISEKDFILSLLLKDVFTKKRILGWQFFFFCYFEGVTSLLPGLHCFQS